MRKSVPEPDGIGRHFNTYQAIMDERDAPVRRNRLRLLGPEQGLIHKPLPPLKQGEADPKSVSPPAERIGG